MKAVEGLPDLKRHRLCRRCQRWFENEGGAILPSEFTGPSAFFDKPRFQCDRCTMVRRVTQASIWIVFAVLLGLVLLLEHLGILK